MGGSALRIGVLTSSRADYGIYLPLLKAMEADEDIELEVIAFGMHLSDEFGGHVKQILGASYTKVHRLDTLLEGDTPEDIAKTYANTVRVFASFWNRHRYDRVICLGDRYEMNAAVQAGIPFGIRLIHIHGGETTLGAIDNIYRHQMTLASDMHFCATEAYAEKIRCLTGGEGVIEVVGALSLDQLQGFTPTPFDEWKNQYKLDGLERPFLLVTVHPETVAWEKNAQYAEVAAEALRELSGQYHILITLTNADTLGSLYREAFVRLKKAQPESVFLVENFGAQGYFTAMHHAALLLGNTSSGIVEAASFHKYVINVGERQKGRISGENVIDVPFRTGQIIEAVKEVIKAPRYDGRNLYEQGGAAEKIIQTIKQYARS